LVCSAIRPLVDSETIDEVVPPVAEVLVSVWPAIFAFSFLEAMVVEAPIVAGIVPLFKAKSVLFIIDPSAFIPGPICVRISPESVCHIIRPLSIVDIASNMEKLPNSMGLMVLPVAFILSTIRPVLDPVSLSPPLVGLCLFQLAVVDSSIVKSVVIYKF
jgi:hypothetical protein